jgi:murein DD-endopeptidase MepM/ murein hydrolase activator NlpD
VGLGVPIVAPGSGTIVAAVGNKADDIPYDLEAAKKEPALMAGNYLVIDRGNGEYSMLGHFRTGTLAVKPGDHVERGQLLAKMGHSGMGSGLVHVHYELRNSPDLFDGDGLPATFEGFRRVGSTVPEPGRVGPGAHPRFVRTDGICSQIRRRGADVTCAAYERAPGWMA